MKSLCLIACLLALPDARSDAQERRDSTGGSATRDTVYLLPPITINPTEAKIRETPATFTNLERKTLAERYTVQDVPVLLADLPSTTFYSEGGNGIGYNYVTLRGFDQRRLSIMINGVPQNDPEDHNVYWIDVPDLLASAGSIQAQRGAGSAFYGPPAIGGSINIVTDPFTTRPTLTFESLLGFQEFGDGSGSRSLNTKKVALSISTGLIDNRVVVYGRYGKILSDGYRTNSDVDLNSYFAGVACSVDDMTLRFHAFGGPLEDGLAYYGLPKFVRTDPALRRENLTYWEVDSTGAQYSTTTPRRPEERESFSQPHYELLHEMPLSSSVTLNNTLFLYTGTGYFDYDASWADTAMLRLGSSYGIPVTQNPQNTIVRGSVENKQWGWLPRVAFDHEGGTVTLGGELRIHRSTHYGTIPMADSLPPDFDHEYRFYEYNGEKDILSMYVHETYRPWEQVTMMADLQFVYDRYGIKNEKYLGNDFDYRYTFVNPRFGINVNIDERLQTYISVGYTSREPRLRNLYAAEDSYFGATPQFSADTTGGIVRYDFTRPFAQPEQLLDIEFGTGYDDGRVRLNWNFYWMEFTNELVKNGNVDIFGQPVTGNAERTRHTGAEIDGSWKLDDHLSLSGNLSLSDNRLIRFQVIENGAPVILDGNPIAGFPGFLSNARISYRVEGLLASLSYKHVGEFHTDNFASTTELNDAYNVLNLSLVYTTPPIAGGECLLRFDVNNLANAMYFTGGEGAAFFPAAERNYLVGLTVKF